MSFAIFSRRGPLDFVTQRVSAVVIALYTLCLSGFILANPELSYVEWVQFINSPIMRGFGLLTVLAVVAHSWIGLWIIGTDYLSEHSKGSSATFLRYSYQTILILLLAQYALFGGAIVVFGEIPF